MDSVEKYGRHIFAVIQWVFRATQPWQLWLAKRHWVATVMATWLQSVPIVHIKSLWKLYQINWNTLTLAENIHFVRENMFPTRKYDLLAYHSIVNSTWKSYGERQWRPKWQLNPLVTILWHFHEFLNAKISFLMSKSAPWVDKTDS